MLLQGKYLVSDELCLKTCDNGVQKCTNTILMLRFVTVLLKIGEAPLRVRSRGYVSFHLFSLFFGSLFIWLMWLFVFSNLLSLPYQNLRHLRVGPLNHTRKVPRREIPSLAWMSLLGTSRALSLIQLTFGHVSVLWAQLIISQNFIYVQEQIMYTACE